MFLVNNLVEGNNFAWEKKKKKEKKDLKDFLWAGDIM